MRLIGQRWEYRIGNSHVVVDNAFSWTLWSQERLVINGETVQHGGGRFRFRQSFSEPWLTRLGEAELSVLMRSRMRGIACLVALDAEPVLPEALYGATWTTTAGRWPPEQLWQRDEHPAWIAKSASHDPRLPSR